MKRIVFVLFSFLAFFSANAQIEQDADTLLWNGKKYAVTVERNVPSVVMSYFQRSGADLPFQSWSLNNGRGHIAVIEWINNGIYLKSVEAKRFKTRTGNLWTETGIDTVVAPDYFGISPLAAEQPLYEQNVFADWFTGVLELTFVPKDKKEMKSDENNGKRYLIVSEGIVKEVSFVSADDFKALAKNPDDNRLADKKRVLDLRNHYSAFYDGCRTNFESVEYKGHKGVFELRPNSLTLVMERYGNDVRKWEKSMQNVGYEFGAPVGSYLIRNDSLLLVDVLCYNGDVSRSTDLYGIMAPVLPFPDGTFLADWVSGDLVVQYGNWTKNSFGLQDYVVYKTQKIRVKDGVVLSSKFSPTSFENDDQQNVATNYVVCNEANVWSVDDKQLAEAVGNYKAPKKTPEFEGGKTQLRNWFLNHPLTDERAKDRLFRVRIGFMVNCDGKAGRWQVISKGKGELFEFSNMVLEIVKTMPSKWLPATDKKGNKVDCWQVMEFTVSNGILTNANYK